MPYDPSAENKIGELSAEAMQAWHHFVEAFEPLRPELYRYCRSLTRSPWDAEDLVQDALMRGFVTLGRIFQKIENPRAWLFRVASNLWIDRERRRRESQLPDSMPDREAPENRGVEAREAGATLIGRLAPQERAAVLLKDVFDFTIEESAEILTTTTGAIKAALHRGRAKLSEPESVTPHPVRRDVLDAFCAALNARDLDRLVALMLDTATVDMVGMGAEYGPKQMRNPQTGTLYHTLFSPLKHAVAPCYLAGDTGCGARSEVREYRGEPAILMWYETSDGPVVRDVVRFEIEGDRIAHIRYYFFSPDVLAEVCNEMQLPWRSNGYHWPFGS